jgi:hypothetical protein
VANIYPDFTSTLLSQDSYIAYIAAILYNKTMLNMGALPDELRTHLPSSLADNRQSFPEFAQSVDAVALRQARDRLLGLTLIHLTHSFLVPPIQEEGLKPVSLLPDGASNSTFPLDSSLGLHRAVFMHLGDVYKDQSVPWITAPAELLFDPVAVVTPKDINHTARDQDTPFNQLPAATRQAVQSKYFSKMLTGVDWLELLSRRLAHNSDRQIRMTSALFGEVKVFRHIRPDELAVVTDARDKMKLQAEAERNGFVE